MTTPFFDEQTRRDIFREEPGLALSARIFDSGLDRPGRRRVRTRTSEFLDEFQGALASQLANFGRADLDPFDFFGGFNFQNEAARFSPQERGFFSSQQAPGTRFLYHF